ncbi:hypothetical protein DPMN_166430 [Dreissena polymorpha]|uniref:Uncharacterized protein n=1 Tax=Dreissena polymorpha TaxID=45954 RepID=A0A9D4EYY6_DREPO|nr:hypothetical protein DPMN_166430 [Dreissena polymorpha]
MLSNELSPHPPAFFEAKNILHKADLPQIIQSMIYQAVNVTSGALINYIPESDCYVLDGGSLFHRVPCKMGDTQRNSRVLCRFHEQATAVFDVYEDGFYIKDITYQRRGQKREFEYEFQQRED